MARVTPKGFYVWDLTTDSFSHSQLAANWDLLDNLLDTQPDELLTSATIPASGNFAGRMVMLTAATGGFGAWTVIRYDGSQWKAVGPFEVLPAVPVAGNYAGRVLILSAANGGFDAWSMIRYDGSGWAVVGGFSNINTGGGALNIVGLQVAQDISFASSARGPVLIDRTTALKYRLYVDDGKLLHEVVS